MTATATQAGRPSPQEARRQALEVAVLLLVLDQRARRVLQGAAKLPLRLALLGATAYEIQVGIRASTQSAIGKIQEGARSQSARQWEDAAGIAAWAFADSPVDHSRAITSADALAVAWRKRLQSAEQSGLKGQRALREASRALESSVDRTATTEAMRAWNSETVRQNDVAYEMGYSVEETWCAIIDACSRCRGLDGTVAVRPDRLPGDPPAHARCRCFISTYIETVRRRAA